MLHLVTLQPTVIVVTTTLECGPQLMVGNMKHGISQEDVCYVVVKYDYAAQGAQELHLRKNERYLRLDDSISIYAN